MNSTIKNKLSTNWHTMRWVALSIGLFLAVMAIWYKDAVTGILSAFFVIQAVTNTGCMVSQSCGVPQQMDPTSNDDSNIEYTEVK